MRSSRRERSKKPILYTSFHEADAGPAVEVELPGTGGLNGSRELVQFRKKAEAFLKDHLGDAAIAKVRSGDPLTAADSAELQRILVAAGLAATRPLPRPVDVPVRSACSSAHWSASTAPPRGPPSPTSSTTSAAAGTRSPL